MALLDLFGKKPASDASVYDVEYSIHPVRLRSHSSDYAQMEVRITNASAGDALTSCIIAVPKGLGFEGSGLSQQREIRLGLMRPGESKRVPVRLWANQRTQPGEYPVKIYVIAHYRDYGHVLNEVRKAFSLRAV